MLMTLQLQEPLLFMPGERKQSILEIESLPVL
jgi:hypothetical protein